MSSREIDFIDLPTNNEEAFIYLERQLREAYFQDSRNDQEYSVDENGRYFGDWEPERTYVAKVLTLLDELYLEIDVPDIIDFSRDDGAAFIKEFNSFKQKIHNSIFRIQLRRARTSGGGAGTAITIKSNYKDDIGKLLETIRKIVNQEIEDTRKKDAIFAKISSLQLEVDRDLTTIDSLFRLALDLTQTMGITAVVRHGEQTHWF